MNNEQFTALVFFTELERLSSRRYNSTDYDNVLVHFKENDKKIYVDEVKHFKLKSSLNFRFIIKGYFKDKNLVIRKYEKKLKEEEKKQKLESLKSRVISCQKELANESNNYNLFMNLLQNREIDTISGYNLDKTYTHRFLNKENRVDYKEFGYCDYICYYQVHDNYNLTITYRNSVYYLNRETLIKEAKNDNISKLLEWQKKLDQAQEELEKYKRIHRIKD